MASKSKTDIFSVQTGNAVQEMQAIVQSKPPPEVNLQSVQIDKREVVFLT